MRKIFHFIKIFLTLFIVSFLISTLAYFLLNNLKYSTLIAIGVLLLALAGIVFGQNYKLIYLISDIRYKADQFFVYHRKISPHEPMVLASYGEEEAQGCFWLTLIFTVILVLVPLTFLYWIQSVSSMESKVRVIVLVVSLSTALLYYIFNRHHFNNPGTTLSYFVGSMVGPLTFVEIFFL